MTLSYPCFNDYYNLFYNNGKKSIPLNIAELLTARGLAQWIMDDGGRDGNGLRLYTNSFTKKDLELLQQALKKNFDLNANIIHVNKKINSSQFKLYIKVESMIKLKLLVKPFMLPSMYYKIQLTSPNNINKNSYNNNNLR
jgi:hypothetical protein